MLLCQQFWWIALAHDFKGKWGNFWGVFLHEDVVFKYSNFESPIWHLQSTFSALNTFWPLPLIVSAIRPLHNAETMSEVLLEISLIDAVSGPLENSVTLFLVVFVAALVVIFKQFSHSVYWIDLDYLLHPLTFALFLTIDEVTFKKSLVSPYELSKTVWLSFSVIPNVNISIMILFSPLAMLKWVSPLPLVLITIRCNLRPKSVPKAILPLSYIWITLHPFPHSVAMLPPLIPLALVCLPVAPYVLASALCLPPRKLTHVDVPVLIHLVTLSFS